MSDEQNYLRLLETLQNKYSGSQGLRSDRTKVGTQSVFGPSLDFSLEHMTLPLLTTKKVNFNAVKQELLWFLRGETNINTLDSKIWNEWATEAGSIGPMYGEMWRSWPFVTKGGGIGAADQIAEVVEALKKDPFSRRHVVSAWHPGLLPQRGVSPQGNVEQGRMALAPCHCLFQFYVEEASNGDYVLSCLLYQRSADVFLGLPFNIASYSLLTHLIAHRVGMTAGKFLWRGGDTHLYSNHLEQSGEQAARSVRLFPTLELLHDCDKELWDLEDTDIMLHGYDPHPAIKAPVAV